MPVTGCRAPSPTPALWPVKEAPGGGPPAASILVINKIDQLPGGGGGGGGGDFELPPAIGKAFGARVATCAPAGRGVDQLEAATLALVGGGGAPAEGHQWAVNQRQAEQLTRAKEALARLRGSILDQLPIDFWTIDVREAAMALGTVSGDDVSEEVLSQIFSRFCLGK